MRCAFLLALSTAAASFGQPVETQLRYEARRYSPDHNEGWSFSLATSPGERIEVRAVVSYVGSVSVAGLGQILFQPVVSNWRNDDSVIGTPGTPGDSGIGPIGSNLSVPPGFVADLPGVYGRITPFATATTTSSTFYRGHVHHDPDGSGATYLRIARNDVTNWIGIGPTSGAGALNNTAGTGGVNAAQALAPPHPPPPNWPPANTSLTGVVVFKFGFTLAEGTGARDLSIWTPPQGIGRSTGAATYGQPDTRWYLSADDPVPGSYRSDVQVVAAEVHVVPTCGVLTVALGVVMRMGRRLRTH